LPVSQLAGTLITTLAENCCLGRYRIGADPHEENVLRVTRDEGHGSTPELWTDAWAVGLGYVAITPLHVTPDLLYVAPRSAPAEAIALPTLMVRTAALAELSSVKSNPARASKTPSCSFKRIRWCQ
jgi:hypothetical protein